MSHFYATIPTSARRTVPSARGHKSTGIGTIGASYSGAIDVYLWHDEETKTDKFRVSMIPWRGAGDSKILARGVVGDASVVELPITPFMNSGSNYSLTSGVPSDRCWLKD